MKRYFFLISSPGLLQFWEEVKILVSFKLQQNLRKVRNQIHVSRHKTFSLSQDWDLIDTG